MTVIYEKMTAETWDYKRSTPVCPAKGAFEISYSGHTYFVVDGELHRENGPAMICSDGSQFYYRRGKCHRADGPAAVWANDSQKYYKHGKCHRTDGPAEIWANGVERYYLFGKEYKQEDWEPLSIQLSLKEQIV